MARFDEFKESLQEARAKLGEACETLHCDEFDSEQQRYEEAYCSVGEAFCELRAACQDVQDDVGILCDSALLEIVSDGVFKLRGRLWSFVRDTRYDSETDGQRIRSLERTIKTLMCDLDRLISGAR